MDTVTLIGLDIGTTTTSCLIASAVINQSVVTGQMQLDHFKVELKAGPIFTPYCKKHRRQLDIPQLNAFIETALSHTTIQNQVSFSSGVIITGLAALSENITTVQEAIKTTIQNVVMVTADDPHYESWLAFMGNAQEISSAYPETTVINIDIGGGTTNIALGKNGQIFNTGSYFIGARHFEFEIGTYQLKNLSQVAKSILKQLDINKEVGDCLSEDEVEAITNFFVEQLIQILNVQSVYEPLIQASLYCSERTTKILEQNQRDLSSLSLPYRRESSQSPNNQTIDNSLLDHQAPTIVTFSGGVGQLIYEFHSKQRTPSVTTFGDLGEALAMKIMHSVLFKKIQYFDKAIIPESLGRSTLFGITFHSTELSGSTIFLSSTIPLPLTDIPIVCGLQSNMSSEEIKQHLTLSQRFSSGVAFQVSIEKTTADEVMSMGEKIKQALAHLSNNKNPLIFLTEGNIGHTLGSLLTQWKTIHPNVFVFDEIPNRSAKMLSVGSQKNNIVPIRYYAFGNQFE